MASQQSFQLSETLDLFTDTYNYNHWIYSLLRPYIGETVLEAGCGIGNMTQFLLNCREIVCIDEEQKYLDLLSEKSRIHTNLKVFSCSIMDIPSEKIPADYFNSVLCVNVLEHIKDDVGAIQKMRSVLKNSGNLVLYVPACTFAFGTLDRNLGHFRRYSKSSLKKLARHNNLELQTLRYVNFIGVFGWFYCAVIKRDRHINRDKTQIVDRMVPYLSAIERFFHPPIGQSLFAVMKKP